MEHHIASRGGTSTPDDVRMVGDVAASLAAAAKQEPRYVLFPPVWHGVGAAGRYWDLLHALVSRAIKQRYKQSVLGFAWTMINPLVTMLILTVVFSSLFATRIPRYPAYVITGLLAWNLFALGSAQGLASIVDSGGLIRKVAVPKVIFPLAAVGANLINFAFALVPLSIILLVIGVPLSWATLWAAVGAVLIAVFTTGVALLLGTVNVFFRDVRYFYEAALIAWFHLTPVFYPPDILPSWLRPLIALNPMYPLVESFRAPIHTGAPPPVTTVLLAAAQAILVLAAGWLVFRRHQARFVDYV